MDAIRIANLILLGFWVLVTGLILLLGQRWDRLRGFRACMLGQWKPALGITLLYELGMGLGGRGWIQLHVPTVFCVAMVGLALARGIPGFEPLPVTTALGARGDVLKNVLLGLLFALVAAVIGSLVGTVGISIARSIFNEPNLTSQATSNFAPTDWQAFWLFLSGAGIIEEGLYRLVVLSLLWRLTRRPGLAVLLSALVFGAYHLTPLSGMYQTFLQFPVSQVLGSTLIGLVWGWLYTRRGYETSVLAHTLSNWLPMLIFM